MAFGVAQKPPGNSMGRSVIIELCFPLVPETTLSLKLLRAGSSLEVQWLGLGAVTAVARVQSLVGELKSCKPHGAAQPKTKKVVLADSTPVSNPSFSNLPCPQETKNLA